MNLRDRTKAARDARAYRATHFGLQVTRTHTRRGANDPWGRVFHDEVSLAVTTNGTQWNVVTFLPDELDDVIAALQTARDLNGPHAPRVLVDQPPPKETSR